MILFEITGRISAKRIYLIGFTVKIKTSASWIWCVLLLETVALIFLDIEY
jgi:hypothetical protein